MILYGTSSSPFVRKVMIFCAEAGIEYELRGVNLRKPEPDFLAASPLAKIPALDDGGFTIADSSAIVHYLHARYRTALIPADPELLARAVWYDEVGDTVLFPAILPSFFNRIVAPLILGIEGDEEAALRCETTTLPPVLAWLESVTPEAGFLLGEGYTLADASIASPLVNYCHVAGTIDAQLYPRLRAYADRMFARPSLAGTIVAEQARFAATRARRSG